MTEMAIKDEYGYRDNARRDSEVKIDSLPFRLRLAKAWKETQMTHKTKAQLWGFFSIAVLLGAIDFSCGFETSRTASANVWCVATLLFTIGFVRMIDHIRNA